jgi:RNA polymerase sigma-70 factor (ECF subfamily)
VDLHRADLTVLALRARDGDRMAEAAFVERTMADVWRYCAHVLDAQHADDATQATYLRALRSLRGFRGDASAKSWLIGVAHHVCLDEMRRWGRRDRLATKLRAQPLDHAVDHGGRPAELVEAVRGLPVERREAFVLTQVLGFSYEDAAAIVGCPVGTIRSRIARARVELIAGLGGPAHRPAGDTVVGEAAESAPAADRRGA